MDKVEQEYSKLMEKHSGKLFIIKNEKNFNAYNKEDSDDKINNELDNYQMGYKNYNLIWNYQSGGGDVFKISINPREKCKVHNQ